MAKVTVKYGDPGKSKNSSQTVNVEAESESVAMQSALSVLAENYYDHFWAKDALSKSKRNDIVKVIEEKLLEISSEIEKSGGWVDMIVVNPLTLEPVLEKQETTKYSIPHVFYNDNKGNTMFFKNTPNPVTRDRIINPLIY